MGTSIENIRKYAISKHNLPTDCQRYGNAPYTIHLEAVISVFNEYIYYLNKDDIEDVEKACWCHDLIEDTDANVREITKLTNEKVSDIVYRVTNERGYNRKESNFKTYPKIWENDLSIFVKLCDRIANVRNSKTYGHKMYEIYIHEYPIFRYALKVRDLYPDMWKELDKLNNYNEKC